MYSGTSFGSRCGCSNIPAEETTGGPVRRFRAASYLGRLHIGIHNLLIKTFSVLRNIALIVLQQRIVRASTLSFAVRIEQYGLHVLPQKNPNVDASDPTAAVNISCIDTHTYQYLMDTHLYLPVGSRPMVFGYAVVLYFVLWCTAATAQHEYDNWHFGDSAAISFASSVPANLPFSAMYAHEGCSSISDPAGNLLFYTNGIRVWNSTNTLMTNGDSLFGGWSSTQAALIVPDPASAGRHYVFTSDHQTGTHGVNYSIVDMTLQGGLGEVTAKNIPMLSPPTDEKLTAIKDHTGNGYWLIAYQDESYFSFHITDTGVDAPVISGVSPTVFCGIPTVRSMRVSPKGDLIATVWCNSNKIELAKFNDTTGVVSNPFLFAADSALGTAYGLEFSQSGNLLYFTSTSGVYQLSVSTFDSVVVANSLYTLGELGSGGYGALQMAPDNKIYLARVGTKRLGAITFPDSSGAACAYSDTGFVLLRNNMYGLPNRVTSSIFASTPTALLDPLVTKICPDSCVSFGNQSTNATSYECLFPSGNPSYSTD